MIEEEKITGLGNIADFIKKQIPRELSVSYAELLPLEVSEYEDRPSSYYEDIPLSIDNAALQLITDKFIRQLKEDSKSPTMGELYKKNRAKTQDGGDYSYSEIYYPPNALAILLYGIMEISSSKGINPELEKTIKDKMNSLIALAAASYARPVYVSASQSRRDSGVVELSQGVEMYAPKREDVIGLDKIENFVRQRLSETGNHRFVSKASLTPLKLAKTISEDGISSSVLSTEVREPHNIEWRIDRKTLAALTDKFAGQLHNDEEMNDPLFAQKIFSPAALGILLHGINDARKDNIPDWSAGTEDIKIAIKIDEAVKSEAENYARQINNGITPGDASPGFTKKAVAGKKNISSRQRK